MVINLHPSQETKTHLYIVVPSSALCPLLRLCLRQPLLHRRSPACHLLHLLLSPHLSRPPRQYLLNAPRPTLHRLVLISALRKCCRQVSFRRPRKLTLAPLGLSTSPSLRQHRQLTILLVPLLVNNNQGTVLLYMALRLPGS